MPELPPESQPWPYFAHRLLNGLGGRVPAEWTEAPAPVEVLVRLQWSDTGEEEVHAFADAWTPDLVRVDVAGLARGEWFRAEDVRRP
ncbi:hypothetical protein [Kineococcus xinjiangensis]|uniref:hypothetical protein n=1 Tax=Kineococcus xinjiangensis TaxID=512762 RepID=UPI0011AFE559|nr:hypothetical protein [Kineococcus xinjiangensis]